MSAEFDTTKAYRALMDAIGGSWAVKAEVLGASRGSLWEMYSGTQDRKPPTLNGLAKYCLRASEACGIHMTLTITPDGRVHHTISYGGD